MTDTHISDYLRAGKRAEIAPLSIAQEQLYFLHLLDPANSAYNESVMFRLTGPLDPDALSAAVNAIVDRHATLRTQFHTFEGEVTQVVLPRQGHLTHHHDAALVAFEDVLQQAAAEAKQPFHLADEPAFRCRLWRRSAEDHVLLFSAHHIVADGWSLTILCDELSSAYSAMVCNRKLELPDLPMRYADYAKAQRSWLSTPVFGRQLQAYASLLEGIPRVLDLPFDHRRLQRPTYSGACHSHPIPGEVWQATQALARHLRSTPFIVLLTAFQVLLQRYSGQDGVLVGVPVAGRDGRDLERLIGLFANVVVVRGQIGSSATFRSAVAGCRGSVLGSLRYSRIPFEKLVESVCRVRDLATNPITQVMFAFHNQPLSVLRMAGLIVTRLPFPVRNAKLDIHVSIEDRNGASKASFIYNTDLFDASTVALLAEEFVTILSEGVASPDSVACRLALRSPGKNHSAGSSSASDLRATSDDLTHRLFEQQSERTPDAIAVETVGQKMTYAQLRAFVRRIAAELKELGAGPERIVGLYLARTVDIVAAPLAVLTAGAAYLPLDPDLPEYRIKAMLEDARPEVLLVSKALHDNARALFAGPILTIEPFTPELLDAEPTPHAASSVDADQLAYVIYTSGSTGRPKGVQISHRALANFLKSMRAAPGLSPNDIVLSVTTLSFDIAALEIFLPLAVGARTFVAPQGSTTGGRMLALILGSSQATVMQSTPSTWRMLLGAGWTGSSQLTILCGGEALDLQLANELVGRCRSLWNLYGPTETTVWSALCNIPGPVTGVNIGLPIANTEIYVLDAEWNLVPPGVPGELYIGGLGVARGYRGRPDLTSERFIPDAFSGRPGARLYGTGDRARQLPNGEFRVLGRLDQQVKVRGYRVELGEIEEALNGSSAVACSAVIWHEPFPGDGRLVAYVQLKQDVPEPLDWRSDLRQHVRGLLPGYAIPSWFIRMDAMPSTPNGKLDRRALPPPVFQREDEGALAPALTPTESTIAGIWCEVLEVGEIGREENFFELGGHSLLAGKAIARIQEAFGIDVALSALFEFPELTTLAAHVDALPRIPRKNAIAAVRRSGKGLPLSFAQQRLWFLYQLAPANDSYHIAAAFRIRGRFDFETLRRTVEYLAARHESIRTRFIVDENSQPVQVIDESNTVECDTADMGSIGSAHLAANLAAEWSRAPFDLERGPVMRVRCARLGAEDHLLVFGMHHIAADGWSAGILIRELSTVYAALQAGESPSLPPLAIQYADYAVWQTRGDRSAALDRQVDFWRGYLEGAPAVFQFAEPAAIDGAGDDGSTIRIDFPPNLVLALQGLAQQERATLFMVLLAAFSTALASMSKNDDVVIGTDVSGRTALNTEGIVGVFVNQLALRVDLSGELTFLDLIARVKAGTLAAFANQDVPFERLVKELQPEGRASMSPLFQIKLVLQDGDLPQLTLPGAAVQRIPLENRRAKFDALVNLAVTGGRLVGYIEFRQSFMTQSRAAELVEQLRATLTHGIAEPARSVTDLKNHARQAVAAMRANRESMAELAIESSLAFARRK
jgi:amino acid adenylation domain-containing protein